MNGCCHCQTEREEELIQSDQLNGLKTCWDESPSHEEELDQPCPQEVLKAVEQDEGELERLLWELEEEELLRYEEEELRRLRWEECLEEERRRWDLEEEACYLEEEDMPGFEA